MRSKKSTWQKFLYTLGSRFEITEHYSIIQFSVVEMELSRQQCLFKIIVLRYLCFEAALQILPDFGADDGILWNNLSKSFLESDFVGWLLKHKFYQSHPSKTRQNYRKTAVERVLQTSDQKFQTVDTTLPLWAVLETFIFINSKGIRGRHIHSYEERGRGDWETQSTETRSSWAFALSNRIYFVKLLPNLIKSAAMLKVIKNRLKTALISEALYSAHEFMAHNIIGTI